MQTRMKLDKNSPKTRKKAMIRHISSPAFQETVAAQPISKGIMRNVTYNSQEEQTKNTVLTVEYGKCY